jgi:hypothetical protein
MSELQGRGGLFSEGRNTHSSQHVECPQDREYAGGGQAGKVTVAAETVFWGCAVKNIRTTLPFHGVRQGFAAF